MDIRVEENPAAAVAELLVEAAERGSQIVLTGGSTPKLAYELAASKGANWSGSTVWFSDERCVPGENGLSNVRMATDALLGRIRADLFFLSYAPIDLVSAQTGENLDRLFASIERIQQHATRSIGTGSLNRLLQDLGHAQSSMLLCT